MQNLTQKMNRNVVIIHIIICHSACFDFYPSRSSTRILLLLLRPSPPNIRSYPTQPSHLVVLFLNKKESSPNVF